MVISRAKFNLLSAALVRWPQGHFRQGSAAGQDAKPIRGPDLPLISAKAKAVTMRGDHLQNARDRTNPAPPAPYVARRFRVTSLTLG